MKKTIAMLLALLGLFAFGCAPAAEAPPETDAAADDNAMVNEVTAGEDGPAAEDAPAGSVYYLNFKPEQDAAWQALAAYYSEETGVPVTVVTAASGSYETTLKSEIAKSEAPTLFQVNGPVGLSQWKNYCYDLKESAVYGELKDDSFALKEGDAVLGIAYAVESYGILYNRALLEEYFAKPYAAVKSVEEIRDFASLKAVAESIQANRKDLGVEGAFTSAGMDASSDWRFKTHLANVPLYYEYKDRGISDAERIEGLYLENYKAIWDLYIQNATCSPALLSSKTSDDAAAEFVTGAAVFYQNGTWAYEDVAELGEENLGILPIYTGVPGEENQGLCTGTENYWCVNKNAAPEDIAATLDFMHWCVSSEEGRSSMAFNMHFLAPFRGFTEDYLPENPLVRMAQAYMERGMESVGWVFSTMPSDAWKSAVGSALTAYAAGRGSWEDVERVFVEGWAAEKAAAKNRA